jgi:hypothetical protein
MNFFCWPIQGSKLIISDCLKTMLSQQPQTLQLHPHDPISFGLMVDPLRFHGIEVQGGAGVSTLLRSLSSRYLLFDLINWVEESQRERSLAP